MGYANSILKAVAVFLGFMVLVVFSAIITMKVITWGHTVIVPAVTGKDTASAVVQLKDAGLDIKVERQEHHPTVPAGSIISQIPPAGNAVKKGRDVLVVVSLGSEEVTVPKLVGENSRRAQVLMKQAGLALGEVVRVSNQAPREEVVQQDPPAGTILQKGAGIDLLVSDGPRAAKFVTPDMTGMTQAEAAAVLRPLAVGLMAEGKGLVADQEPKPGYALVSGSQIKITLGAKPPQKPAVPAKPGQKPAEKAENAKGKAAPVPVVADPLSKPSAPPKPVPPVQEKATAAPAQPKHAPEHKQPPEKMPKPDKKPMTLKDSDPLTGGKK